MIQNYNDFITALFETGFSGAVGGKDDGVFGLFRYGWGAEEETGIQWHTDDPNTDPWQWRIRVLNERDDIAYAKVFFRKAGYITKNGIHTFWLPDATGWCSRTNIQAVLSAITPSVSMKPSPITVVCRFRK